MFHIQNGHAVDGGTFRGVGSGVGDIVGTDDDGNIAGERVKYGSPVKARANVSAAQGEAQIEQFGNSVEYDKVILSDDMSAPIDENTVFFIDTPPAFDSDGNPMFDYIVRKVAKSLNTLAVAISKVRSV